MQLEQQQISIIGAGHMGQALIVRLSALGHHSRLHVSEKNAAHRDKLQAAWPLHLVDDNQAVAQLADCLVLAVKPQEMKSVCTEIKYDIAPETLIISIAAGITTTQISTWLEREHQPILRAMPNLAALIGEGISGLFATTNTPSQQKEIGEFILSQFGPTVWFEHESLLDVVTGLSGSGPGYMFYFLEALVRAGEKLGLSAAEANLLVRQTALGSAKLAAQKDNLTSLRQQVMSPGGTTERGIKTLMDHHFEDIIEKAITQASLRANELSKQYD